MTPWALEVGALAILEAHLRGARVAWPWASAGEVFRVGGVGRGGSVGVVPLKGLLMPEGGWLLSALGGTSLRAFRAQVAQLDADPAVQAIVIDTDSPGGSVHGASEA